MQIRKSNKVTGSFPSIYSCLSVWAWGTKFQTGFSCCWKVLISVCLTESSRWGILDRTSQVLVQNTVPYNKNTQTWAWVCSRPGWFEYLPRNCCVSNSLDGRQEAEMAGDVQRLRSCFTSLGKKEWRQQRLFPGLTVTALVRCTGRGVWKRGMTFCRSSFSWSQECSMALPVCLDNAGDRCRSTGRDEFPWWAAMPGDADERRFQCVLSHVHYLTWLPWQEVLYFLLRDWLANTHWIHDHGPGSGHLSFYIENH